MMTIADLPGTGGGAAPAVAALRDIPSHLRLWLVAVLVLVLDLWSKHWAFVSLDPIDSHVFIPKVVHFHRSLNDGAVFGSLTGMVGLFIVASILALAFVVALFAGSSTRQRSLHVALGLILAGALGNLYDRAFVRATVITFDSNQRVIGRMVSETAGGDITLGEWPDGAHPVTYAAAEVSKVTQQGVVRDFIKFVPRFPSWVPYLEGRDVWPWVFNVADSALVCGVGLLLINFWLDRRRHGFATAPAGAGKATSPQPAD